MALTLKDYILEDKYLIDDFPILPFCHTTSEIHLPEIINNKALKAKKDGMFNEDLIFFFYGKCQYMPKSDTSDAYRIYAPVTFLFKYENIKKIRRMLPFDSGGFSLYELSLHVKAFIIDNPSEYDIKCYIKKMFGSNENYIKRKPKFNIEGNALLYSLKELKRLYEVSQTTNTEYGERAFTLEIQFEETEKNNLEFNPFRVFLPFQLYTSLSPQEIGQYFNGMELDYYGDGESYPIEETYNIMRTKVKNYILESLK